MKNHPRSTYRRYHIDTKTAPNVVRHPYRFKVKVKKWGLAKLLLKELLHYRGNRQVILSRPCVYGVFSGPLGGFAPRENLCVGCLRCTTQYPEMVQILRNPKRGELGDSYFLPDYIDEAVYGAETGRIPVRGAGYRGKFGGKGWDGMWTDMSEIVRPTRDGIHGREFISTAVDIGRKPPFLRFDALGQPEGELPEAVSIPIPLIFDLLPQSLAGSSVCVKLLCEAAHDLQTFVVLPFQTVARMGAHLRHVIPLVAAGDFESLAMVNVSPLLIEMDGWSPSFYRQLRDRFPDSQIILRTHFEDRSLEESFLAGVRTFHLVANYHGRGQSNRFVLEMIRDLHMMFVEKGWREQVTLLGGGGIVSAEHLPKAVICGLDAVSIDTVVAAALQAHFVGECTTQENSHFTIPSKITSEWGRQRLKNLAGSWRDQLLEILGAMGIREVRRLRGEMGRAMFQKDLENDAFIGIAGYDAQ